MKKFLCKLWKNEEGAELVEWVVVAAVLVGIAGVVFLALQGYIEATVDDIGDKMEEAVNAAPG
ncbi:MAG: hypothetical protein VBE63_12960 [Lamprobacter sp.]|uniref:Flp family type IVb pilin n=1 Tax=Lamprobacter sp. TaxID=3100796 RepID=UPI002B2611E8|nr:hypothetical protein [Lamprobacter sp.]MEA3640838.1 hypothetical protein [Lamprobacter sp.]